jgi:hypothetical protein
MKQAVDRAEALNSAALPALRHTSPSSLAACDPTALMPVRGGARNRAISERISANICRGRAIERMNRPLGKTASRSRPTCRHFKEYIG